MPKRFTLAEAQSLIPEVDRLLREAVAGKLEYQEAEQSIRAFTEKVMMTGGMLVHREDAVSAKNRRELAAAGLRNTIEQIQELGCLVKDLDTGLVDFPTLYKGEEVYLCWKLGEPGIAFWHSTTEGFAGRKAIDDDFRSNHQGGRTQ